MNVRTRVGVMVPVPDVWAPLTSTGLELALARSVDCISDRLIGNGHGLWDASARSWSGFEARASVRVGLECGCECQWRTSIDLVSS